MTQGESQGALACSVCLEPVAISGPHQVCALACGHCFGHSCIHTWLERKKQAATADGARSATKKPSRRTFASSSCPTFAPSWTPRSSTRPGGARQGTRGPHRGRGQPAPHLAAAEKDGGAAQGVRAGEGRGDRARQERRRRRTQNCTRVGGGRDGDAAAVGIPATVRRRRLAATENEIDDAAGAEAREPSFARVRPEQGGDPGAPARRGGGGAAEARGGGRAAAQGVDARSILGSSRRSRSRARAFGRERSDRRRRRADAGSGDGRRGRGADEDIARARVAAGARASAAGERRCSGREAQRPIGARHLSRGEPRQEAHGGGQRVGQRVRQRRGSRARGCCASEG